VQTLTHQRSLIFTALSLILLLATCHIDTLLSGIPDTRTVVCTEHSTLIDHPLTDCHPDDTFVRDSEIHTRTYPDKLNVFVIAELNFTNNYKAFIWQPPRLS
jgi:hypothetical protein